MELLYVPLFGLKVIVLIKSISGELENLLAYPLSIYKDEGLMEKPFTPIIGEKTLWARSGCKNF